MAKINWVFQNESGTNLNRYIATNVNTGEQVTFDLLRGGNISIIGTPLNAENLNQLISAINSCYDEITNLTNSLNNGTISVKNAENVKTNIAGVDLQEIFMMDDTYSFEGDKPTVQRAWADSDGNPINSSYHKKNADIDVNSKNVNMGSGRVSWYGGYAYISASTGQGIILALPNGTGLVHYNTTTKQQYKYNLPFGSGTLALETQIQDLDDNYTEKFNELEQRLEQMGFSEGAFTFASGSATTNSIKKQGKYVIANFYGSVVDLKVPQGFRPKEKIEVSCFGLAEDHLNIVPVRSATIDVDGSVMFNTYSVTTTNQANIEMYYCGWISE